MFLNMSPKPVHSLSLLCGIRYILLYLQHLDLVYLFLKFSIVTYYIEAAANTSYTSCTLLVCIYRSHKHCKVKSEPHTFGDSEVSPFFIHHWCNNNIITCAQFSVQKLQQPLHRRSCV